MGQNHRDVRHIKRRRCDVENRRGRLGRSDGDAIQADTEEHYEPHSVDRGMRVLVHFGKDASKDQRPSLTTSHMEGP